MPNHLSGGSTLLFPGVRRVNNQSGIAAYLLLSMILLAAGCATTKEFSSVSQLQGSGAGLKIVLMPLDVELFILTAGGLLEPQAQWTETAQQHMLTAINDLEHTSNVEFQRYQRPEQNDPFASTLTELERLHGAVGQAILFHKYQVPLPSKKDVFDWTLGLDVSTLKERTNADYALFIYVRDSYSSAGRVLFQVAAALLGVGIPGGQQLGFASLVDLQTGNVVWFNQVLNPAGDLRTAEPAAKTVALLLKGLPT